MGKYGGAGKRHEPGEGTADGMAMCCVCRYLGPQ